MSTRSATPLLHRRLYVRGTVQGVGFRPFVHRLATELGLAGSVANTGEGVAIELWGDADRLMRFEQRLLAEAPPLSRIDTVETTPADLSTTAGDPPIGFQVLRSTSTSARPTVSIPVDVTLCPACRRELLDPSDRRFRHPFITCTDCGPRFTIARTLPYDRATTTMAGFEMCPPCQAEYDDPTDRRFHAQPIGCHDCGPHLAYAETGGHPIARREDALRAAQRAITDGRIVAVQGTGGHHLVCDATDPAAVEALRRRKGRPHKPFAVMVRSISVVEELARAGLLRLSPAERTALGSPRRPIVLLRRTPRQAHDSGHTTSGTTSGTAARTTAPRASDTTTPAAGEWIDTTTPAAAGWIDLATPAAGEWIDTTTPAAAGWIDLVAPGVADLGVLLPDTAVHHLLFDGLETDVIVCTSGNLSEEPITTDPADARERLGGIADAFLQHDRPIHTPCDDSIVRVLHADGAAPRTVLVRRSRGWTPEPIELPVPPGSRPVLAMGGDLKGAVCVSDGTRAWMSQHLGDLGSLESFRAARSACEQLVELAGISPEVIAVDAHPGYLSARLGRELAGRWSVPLIEVQHHHAHLASLIADAGRPTPGHTTPEHTTPGHTPPGHTPPGHTTPGHTTPQGSAELVLGVVFDGTGYGPDGTVWGGELLVTADGGRRMRRIGHLRAVPLPGGDAAIEHPARTALAHLHAADIAWDDRLPSVGAVEPADRRVLATLLAAPGRAMTTSSSAGRLIDAVASLVGVRHEVTYEAQAAIELEALADPTATGAYRFAAPDAVGSIDPRPVLAAVVHDVLSGASAGAVSMRFHRAIIDLIVTEARRWWFTPDETGRAPAEGRRAAVALTGGVFQNLLIVEGCADALREAGVEVLTHERVPTSDGGLALGQIVVAGGT